MNWIYYGIFAVTIACCLCENLVNNEIDQGSHSKIDNSNFKKALLQALQELESENFRSPNNNKKIDVEVTKDQSSVVVLNTNTKDAIYVPDKTQLDPITDTEQVFVSASSTFPRSPKIEPSKNEVSLNSVKVYFGKDKSNVIPEETNTATTTTTTTTTVAPTSSTEENEAKVENIQFFSAPLVAAFTVHQDSLGLPMKVQPIFKQLAATTTAAPKTVAPIKVSVQESISKQNQEKYQKEQLQIQQFLHQQEKIRLQNDFLQKQKILEDQIRQLQLQQQQFLLRQQQLQQQQRLFQQQHQQASLVQQKLVSNVPASNSFKQSTNFQNQIAPVQNVQTSNSLPNIIPSSLSQGILVPPLISQPPNGFLSSQALPSTTKNVNFHQPSSFSPNPPFNNLNLQQPPQSQAFKFSQNNFNVPNQNISPLRIIPAISHSPVNTNSHFQNNRATRQEVGTGNFLNNNFQPSNTFVNFQESPIIDTFSESLNTVRNNRQNNDLNQFLKHSGINLGVQSEDLGIISEVLSYQDQPRRPVRNGFVPFYSSFF